MLKNDTLKNSTFRIGLYGSHPPPPGHTNSDLRLARNTNRSKFVERDKRNFLKAKIRVF